MDRIASLSGHTLEGQVVRSDRVPQSGARILLINADQATARHTVTTDARGQFRVTLTSGSWLVYLQDASGRPVFQRRIEVQGRGPVPLTLTSR